MNLLVAVAAACAVVLVGCSQDGASQLEARYPAAAARILSGPGFAASGGGYVRAEKAGTAAAADPVKAAEAALARRGGLQLRLPAHGADAAKLTLPGGAVVSVTERGLVGPARVEGGALIYPRVDGNSYWSVTGDGFEEWIEVANAGPGSVAEWDVSGATLRQAGDAVEVLDAAGMARARVTAPRAYEAGGAEKKAWLRVEGGRLALYTDARGPAIVDPVWTTLANMVTGRSAHSATLLPNGKVLVAGGQGNAVVALATAELFDPATGTWTATGSLATARRSHTATLLQSGNVLLVGGLSAAGASMASAEIYRPATGTWTTTGAGTLATARFGHTATRLNSGKVLVAGGVGTMALGSAELFDPAAGTWSGAGSLSGGRSGHSATMLASGNVLVAGGNNSTGPFKSADLYDAAAGTWSATGAMATARESHTATLLPSGLVLVVGGRDGGAIGSVELYDPGPGTWSSGNALISARYSHTATLLTSGRVLVTNGDNGTSSMGSGEIYDPGTGNWTWQNSSTARRSPTATLLPSGQVLIAGGEGNTSNYFDTAEFFDTVTGSWSGTGPLATARYGPSMTSLPSGKILIVGGYDLAGQVGTAELYDPAVGTWSGTGSLSIARGSHTATLLSSGRVLVVGGDSNTSSGLSSAELYDPGTGTWSSTGSLSTGRKRHTATLLNTGKVLVAGGDSTVENLGSAELYDPATGTWANTGSLGTGRYDHVAVLLESGKVLVAGRVSAGGGYSASTEEFDPGTGTWSMAGNLNVARVGARAVLLPNGKVLLIGGLALGGASASAEIYDPVVRTWTSTGSLSTGRQAASATLLASGRVLVAGGMNGTFPATAEIFDPAFGTWSATGSLAAGRAQHGAALLPNGKVLIAGGWSGALVPSSELFDEGRGAQAGWMPTLTTVPAIAVQGGSALLTGTLFTGASEASSGNNQSSAGNFPLVQLQAADGGAQAWAAVSAFTATTATAAVPATFPPGPAWLRVVTNGVPSVARLFTILSPVVISPSALSLAPRASQAFTASGGSGTDYVWSFDLNASGGSFTSGSTWKAGATGGVPDWIRVTDSLGNYAIAIVTVTAGVAVTPSSALAVPGEQVALTANGGSNTDFTWVLSPGGSGGSVGAAGASVTYTAGSTTNVNDTVTVTDSLGNTAIATVQVRPAVSITTAPLTVPPRGSLQLAGVGGSGTGYTWSITGSIPPGGGINPTTGLFGAGIAPSTSYTVRVTDDLGHFAESTVQVTAGITITPSALTLASGKTWTFTANGGSGTGWTWAFATNSSNAFIGASTGLYQAGTIPNVTDTIQVTDSLGNTATAQITVLPASKSDTDGTKSAYGCSSSGGNPGGPLLLLGAVALLLGRSRRRGGTALLALTLALPLAATAAPAKDQKTRVAVMPIKGGIGIEPKLAELVTDALVAELTDRGLTVITSKDVESALGFEKQKQMLGCGDESCLAEIAGALGADRVVSGDIAQVRELTVFSVQLFNTKTGTVEKRFHERMSGGEASDLLDATERAGGTLFPGTVRSGTSSKKKSVMTSTARPLALVVRGGYDVEDPGGYGLVGLEYRVSRAVRLGLGALMTGDQDFGASVRVGWYPLVWERLSLYGAAETHLLFPSELIVALNFALGAEWAFNERFAVSLEAPLTLVVSAPAEYRTTYFMPAASASWRF